MQGVLLQFKILGNCTVATPAIKYNGLSHVGFFKLTVLLTSKITCLLLGKVGRSELRRPQRAQTQLYFVPCLEEELHCEYTTTCLVSTEVMQLRLRPYVCRNVGT